MAGAARCCGWWLWLMPRTFSPSCGGPACVPMYPEPMTRSPDAPFGRVLTAMATAVRRRRVGRPRRRGSASPPTWSTTATTALVVSGTTGESPDHHRGRGRRDRCPRSWTPSATARSVVAGVGTNDTAHSVELAEQAEKAGADGLLARHARTTTSPARPGCARTSAPSPTRPSLPVMLYDIPGRAGTEISLGRPTAALGRAPADRRGQGRQRRPVRRGHSWPRPRLRVYCGDDATTSPGWRTAPRAWSRWSATSRATGYAR